MLTWTFLITDDAKKDLEKIGDPVAMRIIEKLHWFRYNFDSIKHSSLTSILKGFCKLRVGDWRIVYTVDYKKKIATVHCIDHRDTIYKRKL